MKRFVVLLSVLFCNVIYADTISIHWLNDDGSTYQDSTCTVDGDLILPMTTPTKRGHIFAGWKLVNDYVFLEYIESTGTQYIDTGMRIGSTDNMVIDVSFNGENIGPWFGAFDGTSFQSPGFYGSDADHNPLSVAIYSQTGTTYKRIELPIETANQKYHIAWQGTPYNGVSVDGTYIGAGTTQAYKPTNNFYLFARNNNGTASASRSIRIYNFEVDGKIHLIPARRNSDNVLGMYDLVSETFFTNAGTGTFIAGPVL